MRDVDKIWFAKGLGQLVALLAVSLSLSACASDRDGATYHFSDCQAGAAAGCIAGKNGNPGTEALPKRDLGGIDLSSVPAGTTLLFKRGGAWHISRQVIVNPNTSAAAPLTLADYGSGPLPLLRIGNATAIQFGRWNDTSNDGGYVLRNLKLDGMGTAQWGVFVGDNVHDILIEGVEITGFGIGIHVESNTTPGTVGLTVRNSFIHHNREQGVLAKSHRTLYESNLFEANNPSGSNRFHGMYLSGGNDVTVRNNRFIRNSVTAGGQCEGGNLTIHGRSDGLLIEGNLIDQASALGGCFGISVTAAYDQAEGFRNAVIRGNTVINVGYCSICISAAPGVVVDGNKIYNRLRQFHAGIHIPALRIGPGDLKDDSPVVRNNLICHTTPDPGSAGVIANVPGAVVESNAYRTAADASSGACAR